ncbi:MAG: immunoglobulin domain-containing protein [Verrucomicrobia bacterium]|nr:immunoglobulin domain-containing protein [Verrucomicrobiota bacterium]MCH8527809.1 immunoglobulin domain-containing protein [Kiritimatiellia bacterium]
MIKYSIPPLSLNKFRISISILLVFLAGLLWRVPRESGEGDFSSGGEPADSTVSPAPDVAGVGNLAAWGAEAPAEKAREPAAELIVAEAVFPPATLLDFPEETRAIVQAAESGQPIRVTLGEGDSARWRFRPTPSVAEGFVVSTGLPGDTPTVYRSYAARNVDGDPSAGHQAFLSVAGNRMALMVFRDDGILHVLQDEAGAWRIEKERMDLQGVQACHLTEERVYTTPLSEVLVPWNETDWDRISVEPEWLASDGLDPMTGDLTLTDRPIPYGREYAQSLRSVLNLFVVENAGANTLANASAQTARYLTLSASLHAMFENQLGLNFLMQELVLIVNGSDFESPEIYNSGSTGSGADLGPFGTWLSTHRAHGTYRWSVATKIGRVHSANGRAWLSSTNTSWGVNVNNSSGFSLVGHEIGHVFGSNHTSGGIMNASLSAGARDFFRPVDGWSGTGAHQAYNHLVTTTTLGARTFGNAPLRHPAQKPFANDNFAVTRAGEPVRIDVLANDSKSAVLGEENSVIRVIETGSVSPPHAGTLSHSETHVSFAPSAGFTGTAYFSYTIRGDVGNEGNGWLHKGDVAVQVEDPAAPAPQVTAVRGPAATHHDNERVMLSWEDQGNAPVEWEVQRSVNSGPFQPAAVVAGASPSWIDLRITRSAAVTYRVRARDNGVEPGAWGISDPLPAADDPHAFWDDFASGTLAGWETWTNAPDSIAPNDAPAPHFTFDVSANRARLHSPGGAPRLGLLVRSAAQDLAQTGALSMSASLQMTDAHTWHRVLAWIDDGGAVLWIGIERNRDNNNTRKVRLFGVNSLAEFFQEAGDFNSSAQLFQNNQNGNAGFVVDHRATLTVSPDGVGMTVVPMAIGNPSRKASPVSTLGQLDPGLSNFTGVGRFALGGYANQPTGTTINFFAENVAVSALPAPQKYLPGLVDDALRLKPGEAATLRPSANDIGIVLGYSLQSVPAGWQVHRQAHGDELWTIQSPPDAAPGVYEVVLRSTADNYQVNNDGLTAFSTVYVTVEDPSAQANDLHFTKYRGEGPFSIFPLSNDVHSGFHGLANLDPRTGTNASGGVTDNSYRLLSAVLLTPASGTLEVVTLNAVIDGGLAARPTGELRFSWAGGAPAGTAEIQYTFLDSRGQEGTGMVYLQLKHENAPRITAHPLSLGLEPDTPFQLDVAATGGPLSYQWFRNGVPVAGATGATYSVSLADASHEGVYHVDVTNSNGTVTSHTAVVALAVAGPDAPTHLTATAVSGSRIDLSWSDASDPADPADEFLVERSADGLSGWSLLATVPGTTYSDTGLSGGSTWHYRVIARRAGSDSAPSGVVSATTPAPPVITEQPQSQTAGEGQTAVFSVAATGHPAPDYQWRKNGIDIPGATSGTLELTAVTGSDAANYTVFVFNGVGDGVESDTAVLTVTDPPPPAPAGLTATAAAFDQIDLAWSDASDLSDLSEAFRIERSYNGTTWSTLTTVAGTSHSDTGLEGESTWFYRVFAQRDGLESEPSGPASATTPAAPAAPVITTQPQSQSVFEGANVSFSVTATGNPVPDYQWRKGGVDISGATDSTLTLTNVTFVDAGNFTVFVSNGIGEGVESDVAVLTVNEPGTLLIYEGFDYDISLTHLHGRAPTGEGLSGTWSQRHTGAGESHVVDGLTFGPLVVSGNAFQLLGDRLTSGLDRYNVVSIPVEAATTAATLWTSHLVEYRVRDEAHVNNSANPDSRWQDRVALFPGQLARSTAPDVGFSGTRDQSTSQGRVALAGGSTDGGAGLAFGETHMIIGNVTGMHQSGSVTKTVTMWVLNLTDFEAFVAAGRTEAALEANHRYKITRSVTNETELTLAGQHLNLHTLDWTERNFFPVYDEIRWGADLQAVTPVAGIPPPPLTPPELSGLLMLGGGQGLRLQTQSDFEYLLEYTDTLLGDPEWLPVGNWTPGNDSDLELMDETQDVPQRFYRLRKRWRTGE